VNGGDAHPLWKWLKSQIGGWFTDDIKWNFTKFLSDRQGVPFQRYGPSEDPLTMEDEIIKLLAESL
jgi:glutathione peroxidase-family protein